MDFCSIEEAFPNHNKEALRQERKKAKRCKGPAQAFIDPDRLNTSVKKPIPPAMNPLTGLREHEPVDEEYEGFSGGGGGVGGGDTNERLAKDTSPAAKNYGKMPNIEQVDKQLAKNNAMPSFFWERSGRRLHQFLTFCQRFPRIHTTARSSCGLLF